MHFLPKMMSEQQKTLKIIGKSLQRKILAMILVLNQDQDANSAFASGPDRKMPGSD